MTTGLVRLAGDGSRGVGLGLLQSWEPVTRGDEDGVSLAFFGNRTMTYWGDDAARIVKWLHDNSECPIIAPGAGL